MYEENRKCLGDGDASVLFAQQLAEIARHATIGRSADVTPDSVVRWAEMQNQPRLAAICRRLLLPGSGIKGCEHLRELVHRACGGQSCLLCLNHRSNLDVPTLYTLLEDHGHPDLFHRIIWIAGRKLEEDDGLTGVLIQCVHRVIVTPPSWFATPRTDQQLREARIMNIAAERAVARLRHDGWVLALFPTGTRIRGGRASTRQAIGQTYGYVRSFENLALCHIDGCTLPVSRDRDFTHETPRLDRVIYTFGPVRRSEDWLAETLARSPELDPPEATARAIVQDIDALGPSPRAEDQQPPLDSATN